MSELKDSEVRHDEVSVGNEDVTQCVSDLPLTDATLLDAEEQTHSVVIHYHKHPTWKDTVQVRVSSQNTALNQALGDGIFTAEDEGEDWYVVKIDLPQALSKDCSLKVVVCDYDEQNDVVKNHFAKTLTCAKELWIAKNGRIKKSMVAVEKYEDYLFDWKSRTPWTRASLFVMGISHLKHKRIVEGLLFLLVEIAFIAYIALSGVNNLIGLVTLGTVEQEIGVDADGWAYRIEGDNSMRLLLSGVITLVICALFVVFYIYSIRSSMRLENDVKNNRNYSFKATIKSYGDKNLYKVMLIVPLLGMLVFTIIPLVYMILIAFTNYDQMHQPPGQLFDWVGFDNFLYLLGQDANFSSTFWRLFGWTMIWAFFSTFTCFFGGMGLAMLINNNKVKGKGIFRTIFVLTIAIPSFISLLSIGSMLQRDGVVNMLLQKYGFTSEPLPFFTDTTWARVTVIIVNMWIGVPISMLITTGILLNIPQDLFESAKIDGANKWVIFRKIIMPYVMFVCTPYLINAFISNVNNFNVIYFLTGGGPMSLDNFKGAGGTDLLVTWLYKLTVDNRDYSYASAIGIIVFLISASLSLIVYRRSSSFKNEGSF